MPVLAWKLEYKEVFVDALAFGQIGWRYGNIARAGGEQGCIRNKTVI